MRGTRWAAGAALLLALALQASAARADGEPDLVPPPGWIPIDLTIETSHARLMHAWGEYRPTTRAHLTQNITVTAVAYEGTLADMDRLNVLALQQMGPGMHLLVHEPIRICGKQRPAYHYVVDTVMYGQPVREEEVMTEVSGTPWMATYSRPLSQPYRPAASAALRTMCHQAPPVGSVD